MHADEGEIEEGLGHEVAIGHGIEAVVERGGEAEVGRRAMRIERQRRAREGAGTQRRHVEAVDRGEKAIDVAGQRPPMGQQVVGQQDRLGPLHVRVPRQRGVARRLGAVQQHRLETHDARRHFAQLALAPQP